MSARMRGARVGRVGVPAARYSHIQCRLSIISKLEAAQALPAQTGGRTPRTGACGTRIPLPLAIAMLANRSCALPLAL